MTLISQSMSTPCSPGGRKSKKMQQQSRPGDNRTASSAAGPAHLASVISATRLWIAPVLVARSHAHD